MSQGRYGVFLHYQYRILLGYSIKTKPQFPGPAQMTAAGWNRLVDGFDVQGFARQMAEVRVGWVLFCLDDHYFAWPCAPNRAFSDYTGYAPGQKCSRRDLILDLAEALNARGVKLICYFAGLNGYMKEPQVSAGLGEDASRGPFNDRSPPSEECRRRRLAVLKEYADRYQGKIAGWWFDGMGRDTYQRRPDDWQTIASIVRGANPKAVIGFSYGANEQAGLCPGVDDYTGGDTWSKQDLTRLTPQRLPAQKGILWHGKIYCGNVYHGQGDANQFSDQELIDWINTCNRQGGVCTLDWPFDPQTGLLKDFGLAQLKRIARALEPAAASSPVEPTFHVCPLDLAEIRSITPLGNLNPRGGHVFPTDHIYLDYGGRVGLPVRAPAAGCVFAIRGQIRDDFKIEIQVGDRFSYYVAHVLPVKELNVGSTVESGQVVAYTTGRSLLDFGCVDTHVALKGFVNPDRYPGSTLHCVSPLRLYGDPLRSQLYTKVMRDGPDKDGRIDYDIAGRLVGNWFLGGSAVVESSRGLPQIWAQQLAFAYDVHRPDARRVSVGGTIASAGLYGLSAVSPDPAEISVTSGPVKLLLTGPGPGQTTPPRGKATSAPGVLLVQMLAPNQVKVEFFRDRTGAEVTGFTESARIYER